MQKHVTILLLCLGFCTFSYSQKVCGDGNLYVSKKQVKNDMRFQNYKKINSAPKFKGGKKTFEAFMLKNLVLSANAKKQVFNMNYQFTINCYGDIKDVKALGEMPTDFTNLEETIPKTKGLWKPARHKRRKVDCIYFGKLFINGTSWK